MSGFHLVKPSVWRAFWSFVAAVFVVYIVTVIVVYILAITMRDSPLSTSSNGHIGFLMWDILFAAPVYVLAFWFITVPVIIALGVLVASLRRTTREVEPGTRPS